MRLVDLNYNFECDWFLEQTVQKLSHNNLAGKLVKNMSFLNQAQPRKF